MIEQRRREYLLFRIKQNSRPLPNGCAEWTGARNPNGYGSIRFNEKSPTPVHRALYQAHYNIALTRQQRVCFKCENHACVNIDHLFVGTPSDRKPSPSSSSLTRTRKFTDVQIQAIRASALPLRDLAFAFGTTISYISKIKNRKAKALVPEMKTDPHKTLPQDEPLW